MLEFDRDDGPYMQEGYWGTHSPEDECAYTRLQLNSIGVIEATRRMWAEREPMRLATDTMNDFLRLPSRELVHRLHDGETFRGADYPLGTIVQYDEEYLYLGQMAAEGHTGEVPLYQRRILWGVVAQLDYPEPSRTVLMRISEGFVHFEKGRVERTHFFIHEPTLEVGMVVHFRRVDSQDQIVGESFRRVLSANLWMIGKKARKPVYDRSDKGFLGRLNPLVG